MVSLSKRHYGLLALWVVGASALGVFLIRHFSPPPAKDILAPQADIRRCGPGNLGPDQEMRLAAEWVANPKDPSDEVKRAVARVLLSLPERVLTVLKSPATTGDRSPIKIALDQGKWPFMCADSERSGGRLANTCLKAVPGIGRVLLLGRTTILSPDGRLRQLSDADFVDQTLLPVIFWLAFERLGNLRDEKPVLPETEVSKSNVFSQMKYHIVSGYKFSPEEETFYLREFGASSTATPTFVNRTLALTASNLHCHAESFARLEKTQPEAVKRFMSAMGCSLGKPWHMSEEDFSKLCPNLASSQ